MNNKRGLSTVVTTLILILLVLVAIGIVWVVIRNVISETAEDVSLGWITINLNIKNVQVQGDDVLITVKRNPGKGNLTGIKFVVSDGVNSEAFEEATSLQELGESTFSLALSEIDIFNAKTISIAPILKSESGKEYIGNIVDSYRTKGALEGLTQFIQSLGGVSWWRFEGNANDEIGENDGIVSNGVTFVEGKHGQAVDFSLGTGINAGSLGSPPLIAETSIAFWIKSNDVTSPSRQNPFNQAYGGWGTMTLETSGSIHWYFGSSGVNSQPYGSHRSNGMVTNGEWVHVVAVRDPSDYSYKWYKNGDYFRGGNYDSSYPVINTRTFTLGDGYVNPINGLIDEFIIFNKALTEDEVKALYELDLS